MSGAMRFRPTKALSFNQIQVKSMKYAIDKQFGIWRYARQPVMGKWFFKLGEKMVNNGNALDFP